MNAKKTKALRKEVYGDKSIRERRYEYWRGMRIATGLRRVYQDLKKENSP